MHKDRLHILQTKNGATNPVAMKQFYSGGPGKQREFVSCPLNYYQKIQYGGDEDNTEWPTLNNWINKDVEKKAARMIETAYM